MNNKRVSPNIKTSFKPEDPYKTDFTMTITANLETWKDIAAGLVAVAGVLSPGREMARVIEQMVSEAEMHWTGGEHE